jgi:small-conductance mechanosensitive channel
MDQTAYPVRFAVEYPDRPLNRLTTFFRVFVAIPILIVLGTVSGESWEWSSNNGTSAGSASAGGLLFLAPLLMIVFRQKYPRWWFDWNLELQRFGNRIIVYLGLMDDRYPSTDEHQSVQLDYDYPDAARDLNRWMPLVKWFLAIPHYFVLIALNIAAFAVIVAAWFAILFTARYPRSIFEFVEGVMRWNNRVAGYAFTLVTDEYPPFRLSP